MMDIFIKATEHANEDQGIAILEACKQELIEFAEKVKADKA